MNFINVLYKAVLKTIVDVYSVLFEAVDETIIDHSSNINVLDFYIRVINILIHIPFLGKYFIPTKIYAVEKRTILHFGLKPIEMKRKTVVFDNDGERIPSLSGLYAVEFVETEDFDQKYDPDEHGSE